MHKQHLKHLLPTILLCLPLVCLLLTGHPVQAAQTNTPKEEIVYGKLAADGQAEQVYVVNLFHLAQDGQITDYGDYSHLVNLTNEQPLEQQDGHIQGSAQAGSFYYQGDLPQAQLPWLIEIAYDLDGQQISPEALGGATGHLQLEITIDQNPAANPLFFENYALQITITWPGDQAGNIIAEGGTIANAGSNKTISYIVFANRQSKLVAEADIRNFSMEGIQFAGISLALSLDDLDTGDMLGDLHRLQDGVVELDDGVLKLNDGVLELNDGVVELYDGVAQLNDQSGQLEDGARELNDGAFDLLDAIDQMSSGAADLNDGLIEYADGVSQAYTGAKKLKNGAAELADGAALLTNGDGAANGGFRQYYQGVNQLYLATQSAGLAQGAAALAAGSSQFLQVLQQQAQAASLAATDYNAQAATYQQQAADAQNNAADAQEAAIQGALTPVIQGLATAYSNSSASAEDLQGAIATALGQLQNLSIDGSAAQQYAEQAAQYAAKAAEAVAKAAAYTATAQALDQVAAQYRDGEDGQGGLHSGLTQLVTGLNGDGTAANPGLLPSLSALDSGAYQVLLGLEKLTDGLETYADGTDEYSAGLKKLSQGGEQLADGSQELTDGTVELRDGAADYHQGTNTFFDGIVKLKDGVRQLFDGTGELKDGTGELTDGASQLKDGTGELRQQTGNMDQQVEQQIEDLLAEYGGREFTPVSFVSPQNSNIDNVQFVMLSTAIDAPEDAPETEDTTEADQTLWQRIAALGKYFNGFTQVWQKFINFFTTGQ